MLRVRVTLDFACVACRRPVTVTLQCEGKGLAAGEAVVASVNVPCPTCGAVNELSFDPAGTVHAVKPHAGARLLPVPSVN